MDITEKALSLFVFQSLGYDLGRSASRLPELRDAASLFLS